MCLGGACARRGGWRPSELAAFPEAAPAQSANEASGTASGDAEGGGVAHAELQELKEAPRGRVDIEYRAWLNVDDREVQAGVARRPCANADHGGAFVVFQIVEGVRPAGLQRPQAGPYAQAGSRGIVRRYLILALQVGTYWGAALATGKAHCVVTAPSCEAMQGACPSTGPAGLCAVQLRSS